ncbi:DUF2490 domain-containing protein [Tenacibaculum sp. 190524A05c]|uniref:DUF2490 domain-containing protein n=1 Tax=Tenacibaculum platacis TaxID=3137852 RepID=UPI0032B0F7C5
MKRRLLALLALFVFCQINAQQNPEKELGIWYMYNGSHKISDKFSIKSMAHFRFFEIGEDMQQYILRFGLNYKIDNTLSATLGYAFLDTDTTFGLDGGTFGDHRIYEDLLANHKISKLSFAHRLRAEHRFFNSQTGHLLRYQLGLSYPIAEKWSTYIYDEVFFDFDGGDAYNQNWFGLGFKYQLSKVAKLQLGYMSININNQNLDRIQLGIAISTDHRKKKK